MECGIAGRGKPGASTWDWVFGGQTPPTGGEVGLRAGRPWSVARDILRPGDASAVLRCPDPRYMIGVTFFCTSRESKNTRTCENRTRFAFPALLTPVRGLKLGNTDPHTRPHLPRRLLRHPRPPCSLRPHRPFCLFLVSTARTKPSSCARRSPQTPCCPQCLGFQVSCHARSQ